MDHMLQEEEGWFERAVRFVKNLAIAIWREGFTVIFQSKLIDPGDPETGEGRKSDTRVKFKPGFFDGDECADRYLDHTEGQDQDHTYGYREEQEPYL